MAIRPDVRNIQEVNDYYAKVRADNLRARHVVCGFRISHPNFVTHENSMDDDEHGLGLFLLQLLRKSGVTNKAVFVARYYDGTHIGKARYQGFISAIKSCFIKSPFNEISGENQFIWDGDYTQKTGEKMNIRGRGRGRGHQQHGSNRGTYKGNNPDWLQTDQPN